MNALVLALILLAPCVVHAYAPHTAGLPDGVDADQAEWIKKMQADLVAQGHVHLPLNRMIFPATHDSGAVRGRSTKRGSTLGQLAPTKALSHAQAFSVREQLFRGARLMDLRFTRTSTVDREWYIHHGDGVRYDSHGAIFSEVRDFMDYTLGDNSALTVAAACEPFFMRLKLQYSSPDKSEDPTQRVYDFFADMVQILHRHLVTEAPNTQPSFMTRDPCTFDRRVFIIMAKNKGAPNPNLVQNVLGQQPAPPEPWFDKLLGRTLTETVPPTANTGTWETPPGWHGLDFSPMTVNKVDSGYRISITLRQGEAPFTFSFFDEESFFAGGAAEKSDLIEVLKNQVTRAHNYDLANQSPLNEAPMLFKTYATITMGGLSVRRANRIIHDVLLRASCKWENSRGPDLVANPPPPLRTTIRDMIKNRIKVSPGAYADRAVRYLQDPNNNGINDGYLKVLHLKTNVWIADFYGSNNSDKLMVWTCRAINAQRAAAITAGGNYETHLQASPFPALIGAFIQNRPNTC